MEEGKKKKKAAETNKEWSTDELNFKLDALIQERRSLMDYYRVVMVENGILTEEASSSSSSENSFYCCLLEERNLPFTKLAEEIYEKIKKKDSDDQSTLKSVGHKLHVLGHRNLYGIDDYPESDVQEDTNQDCLWCWESKDISNLPEIHIGSLNIRRYWRKEIHQRIMAVSRMIDELAHPNPNIQVINELEDKLAETTTEAKIRVKFDKANKKLVEKAEKEKLKKNKLQELMEKREKDKENLLLNNERRRLEKEALKILARFDQKKLKLEEKTLKLKTKIKEELKKIEKEAIEEGERIKKEQEDMREKLKKETEVKLIHWLKKRSEMLPCTDITSTPSTPPRSPDFIDVDKRVMDEATSPIESPPLSIRGENLMTEAPLAVSDQSPQVHSQSPQGDQNQVQTE